MIDAILSIDPGIQGALSWLTGDGHLIEVIDMPVIEIVVGGKKRRKVNATELSVAIKRRPIDFMIVESVVPFPTRDKDGHSISIGATVGASASRCAGILEGIAAALGISYAEVRPNVWKKRAGVPTDKGGARLMAQRTWPGAADQFKRVRDDGRAESALMGRWIARNNKPFIDVRAAAGG